MKDVFTLSHAYKVAGNGKRESHSIPVKKGGYPLSSGDSLVLNIKCERFWACCYLQFCWLGLQLLSESPNTCKILEDMWSISRGSEISGRESFTLGIIICNGSMYLRIVVVWDILNDRAGKIFLGTSKTEAKITLNGDMLQMLIPWWGKFPIL